MRKTRIQVLISLVTLLLVTCETNSAHPLSFHAQFPSDSLGLDCAGWTHNPHLSTHFPGTINVTAETRCPGKEVYVNTTLIVRRWFFISKILSTDSNKGLSRTVVNVHTTCLKGSRMNYEARSKHWTSDGAVSYTSNSASILC